MVTIDALDLPVVIDSPFGQVTLTHRAWGFTIQAWNNPPMQSYSVLGVLEDGAFKVYQGTEEYAKFSLQDFIALSSDPTTGPHVVATIDAVKAAHQRIVGTNTPQPLTAARPSEARPETIHGETPSKPRTDRAVRRPARRRR